MIGTSTGIPCTSAAPDQSNSSLEQEIFSCPQNDNDDDGGRQQLIKGTHYIFKGVWKSTAEFSAIVGALKPTMDNSDFEREFPYVPEFAQNPHTLVGKRVVVGGIHFTPLFHCF